MGNRNELAGGLSGECDDVLFAFSVKSDMHDDVRADSRASAYNTDGGKCGDMEGTPPSNTVTQYLITAITCLLSVRRLRLTLPNEADETRSRWPIHPLWQALSSVDWEGNGAPLVAPLYHYPCTK